MIALYIAMAVVVIVFLLTCRATFIALKQKDWSVSVVLGIIATILAGAGAGIVVTVLQ